MMTGKVPFDGTGKIELYKNILKADIKIPERFSTEFKDLMKKMLHKDPKERITVLKNSPVR